MATANFLNRLPDFTFNHQARHPLISLAGSADKISKTTLPNWQ